MSEIRILDVTDAVGFGLLPPCADPSFDHRTCDYWEDADRGSKLHRAAWLPARPTSTMAGTGDAPTAAGGPRPPDAPANPFVPEPDSALNPFAPPRRDAPANPFAPDRPGPAFNPFVLDLDEPGENPFVPQRATRATPPTDAPRKLALLGRGAGIFGSYARVLLVADRPVAFAQFGPLSAYPRALRLRDLYPQLPAAPLPAVITCIATAAEARRSGHALRLIASVCDELAGRGFSAVEAYPEAHASPEATSAASVAFWLRAGFAVAVADERFPVVRRDLA